MASITPSAVVPNDSCAQAALITALTQIGDAASIVGRTHGARDDLSVLTCPSRTNDGRGWDVFYELTVPIESRLRITQTSKYTHGIEFSVHAGSCSSISALACGRGSTPVTTEILPPGSYFLRVEQPRTGIVGDEPTNFSFVVELLAP